MKTETHITIKNGLVWAFALVGWIFMITEAHNSYYELVNLPMGIAPPIQVVVLLMLQVAFYSFFVLLFLFELICQLIDYIKISWWYLSDFIL
ncbi:hypothetical protein [uncultured Methanolobus sp.]|uniref:hypothetical protein n=1 Tax=uncultured Methanolobus sp. TaxID=218300 RepID=UPI002AAACC97|nr:hypothetical protein [uncultured Methanolobus sp.]